jgi:hypothetical protein
MPKLKCNFTEDLKVEFPFLKEESGGGRRKVFCTFCRSSFSIEYGGQSEVLQHTKVKKHKLIESSKISSQKLTTFLQSKKDMSIQLRLASKESVFAFQAVKHNHSFLLMDCTSAIVKRLYEKKNLHLREQNVNQQ